MGAGTTPDTLAIVRGARGIGYGFRRPPAVGGRQRADRSSPVLTKRLPRALAQFSLNNPNSFGKAKRRTR
jgi:hypothetical protein